MDLRRRSGLISRGSAGASSSSSPRIHAPLFLARTLRYDAAESTVARRDARVLAAIEWSRSLKATEAARARTAERERERRQRKKQRKSLHAAVTEPAELPAAVAAAAALESSPAAASVEPYISPADLLGVKLAVAAAAAKSGAVGAAKSGRGASANAAKSGGGVSAAVAAGAALNTASFDRSRVSKRLQITLERMVFFGSPIVAPVATTSAGSAATSASASAASVTPTPPVLSAAQYQHLHAAAPSTLDASAHLCSSPLDAPPSVAALGPSRVESVLGVRLEKDRAASEPSGHVGLSYTPVPAASSDTHSAASPNAAAAAAPVPLLFSSVNFFTHPSAVPPRTVTTSAVGQKRYRNLPLPSALEDESSHTQDASMASSSSQAAAAAWSVRIVLSPPSASPSSSSSATAATSAKHLNKGRRIHALTASNNARAADCLADTTQALIRRAGAGAGATALPPSQHQQGAKKSAAAASPSFSSGAAHPALTSLGGYFAPAAPSLHSVHHQSTSLLDPNAAAATLLPDALQPCRVPRAASLAPGSFLVHIPLLRLHRQFQRSAASAAVAMEWVEDCEIRAHILASPSAAAVPAADLNSAMGDTSTPAPSTGDVIVGSCVVQLRWVYTLHARSVIPRPIRTKMPPRAIQPAAAAMATPSTVAAEQVDGANSATPTPVMLAWRFIYNAHSAGSAAAVVPSTHDAAAGSKPAASSPAVTRSASATPAAKAGVWDAVAGCVPIGDVAASSVEHTVDFSCAFCSMRGADSVGGGPNNSAAAAVSARRRPPLLRDFTSLVRHLESSHSEFLSFQYGLPKRAQMGLAGEDSAAPSADSTAESSAASPVDASLSQEVMTYEIVVRAKASCSRLRPIVARSSAAGVDADVAMDAPFLRGGLSAAAAAALAAPSSTGQSQSAPYATAADNSRSYFCFFGLRYAPSPYALTLQGPAGVLSNSYAKKSAVGKHVLDQPMEDEAAASGGTRKKVGADGAEAALSIKDLISASGAGPRGSAARGKSHASRPSRSQSHHPDHPLAPAALSVAAAACLASNPALYSRQWFHASSGLPLALCELGYDSDSQGGAGGGGDVDEEWLISAAHRHLDEFSSSEVSHSEKQFMKIWNEFVLRRSSDTEAAGGGAGGPIYADYLFPRVCADFARVARPLFRRLLGLRTGFLLHLMTSWEFGLVSGPEIEACMRIADDHSDSDDEAEEEQQRAAATAAAAAAKNRSSCRAQHVAWMSLHAPSRARQYRSELDAAGGFPPREKGAAAGLGSLALLQKDAAAASGSTAHPPAPRAAAAERAAAEKRKRASSPPDDSAAAPRSARLRERGVISELEAAKEAARQKKRDRRAARDCGRRYRNKAGLKTLSSSTSSSSESSQDDDDDEERGGGDGGDDGVEGADAEDAEDADDGAGDAADSSADDSPSSSPLVHADRRAGMARAKNPRRMRRRQQRAEADADADAGVGAATPMDEDDDCGAAATEDRCHRASYEDDGVERKAPPTPPTLRPLHHPPSTAAAVSSSALSSSARKNPPGGTHPPSHPHPHSHSRPPHTHATAVASSKSVSNEAKRRRTAE